MCAFNTRKRSVLTLYARMKRLNRLYYFLGGKRGWRITSVVPSVPAKLCAFCLILFTSLKHVIKICQTACYELKRISANRRYLTEDATEQLVTFCALSRLDYCNSLLMGTPSSVIQPMQKVQNTTARLILRAPRHRNLQPLLRYLHWLPISNESNTKLLACVTTQS